jgi:hypothetical protein
MILEINKADSILIVGVDIAESQLTNCTGIVWHNRGLTRFISKPYIVNMQQHLINMKKHPKFHRGMLSALVFHWEQTIEYQSGNGSNHVKERLTDCGDSNSKPDNNSHNGPF